MILPIAAVAVKAKARPADGRPGSIRHTYRQNGLFERGPMKPDARALDNLGA